MIKENDNKPVDLGRRRLAKGGVAVSAVLATLASKNALAAFPYQCGLSGKLSNNNSPNGPKTTEPCDLGNDATAWETSLTDSSDTRTFNAMFGVALYYYNSGLDKISSNGSAQNAATLLQVLTKGGTVQNAPVKLAFAKLATVTYLNAGLLAGGTHYPLTQLQVTEMFKDVIDNVSYSTETSVGTITFQPDDIRDYFMELYPSISL